MTSKIILSNALFKLASFIFQVLAKLGTLLIIGRIYGVEVFGVYSFVIVLNGLFVHVCNMGWNSYAVYSISKGLHRESEIINRLFPFAVIGSGFAVAVSFLVLTLLSYNFEITLAVLLLNTSLFFESYILCIKGVFDGNQRMFTSSLIAVVADSILFVCIVTVALLHFGLHSIFASYILCRFATFYFATTLYKRNYGKINYKFIPDKESLSILKKALPFAVNRFATMGFNRFDILLLSYFSGNIVVGVYNAAISLILKLNSLVKPFIFALFPVLSKSYAQDRALYRSYFKKSSKYVIALSIPVFTVFFVVPEKIMVFLYGMKFIGSGQILKVLSFMLILKYLNPLIGNAITASGNQSKRTVVISLSLVVNILLNIVLIPRYNALGAAYSSVATEAFISLLFLYVVLRNKIGSFISLGLLTKLSAALVMVLLSTFFVPELPLPLSVIIIFLMAFMFCLGLRIIHKDEMKHLFLVLKKRT